MMTSDTGEAFNDTGSIKRPRHRPLGSNYDHLDTGRLDDAVRLAATNGWEFDTAARVVGPTIYRAASIQPEAQIKRLRRQAKRANLLP